MSELSPIELSAQELAHLRGELLALPPVTPIVAEPKLTATLAAIGIQQEVGTINDEMARFVYDYDSGQAIARERMRAELVRYRGFTGVRIWAEATRVSTCVCAAYASCCIRRFRTTATAR